MVLFFSNKAVRLLLSVSVSIWMAGGCLFGCSNSTMAADVSDAGDTAAMAGESCHAKRSHDCCAKAKPKKPVVSTVKLHERLTSFASAPQGMLKDCPLVVGSTAASSKSNKYVPEPARAPVTALPRFEKQIETADNPLVVPFLPNRGPTHLRCCVFLI